MTSSVVSGGGSCPHFQACHLDASSELLSKYKATVSWSIVHKSGNKRRKLSYPSCGSCYVTLSRPMACLHCDYIGCWTGGHIHAHLKTAGHLFCVEAKSGRIYCSSCDDFIVDARLDKFRLRERVAAEERVTQFQVSNQTRDKYVPWSPTTNELATLSAKFEPLPCQRRRGLLNLGQTCWMNVVLQCLAHNPLLRNYFLGDKHNHLTCKIEDGCTCCEMDKYFTQIYSGEVTPLGPISFLSTFYKKTLAPAPSSSANSSSLTNGSSTPTCPTPSLSDYAQQDAHEFLISTLNAIHATSKGSTNVSCNCIIHSTFQGTLMSEIKCGACEGGTRTMDPFLDVSLVPGGTAIKERDGGETLEGCLRRYTRREKLGVQGYSCSKCGKVSNETSKRMSFNKLPPVLCFQFKRFEHRTVDRSSAYKIDTPVQFPTLLNMAPFTTNALTNQKQLHEGSSLFEYDLFAVINHEGQLDNGHYTNYAKHGDQWYKFNDDKVSPAMLHSDVLSSSSSSTAYICFYVKRHLEFKPHTKPSYILVRENEAVREREREKEKAMEKEKMMAKNLEREREKVRLKDKEIEDELLATL